MKSKSFKLFCSVSGKDPKLLSNDEKQILKGYTKQEESFYIYIQSLKITSPMYKLRQFIPEYSGTLSIDEIPVIYADQKIKDQRTLEWLRHLKKRYKIRNPENKFIVMENVIWGYERPNVIDIKLGEWESKKLKPYRQISKQFFRLNGCRINVKHLSNAETNSYEILFFSKYFFKSLSTEESIFQHLALYFFDGEKLKVGLLEKIIDKLTQLILSLKSLRGWKFFSSSVCFFYDSQNDKKFDIKLIDFGRSSETNEDKIEQPTINGLQNVHRLLIEIKRKYEKFEQRLFELKNKYLEQKILIVPDRKVIKYEGKEAAKCNTPEKQF